MGRNFQPPEEDNVQRAGREGEHFAWFARERLGAEVFQPDPGKQEDAVFVASLNSTMALTGWTREARNARGEPFMVIPGYLDRMTPNAVADRAAGVHFIGYYQALLVTMVEFALFCFTQREIFPSIGDAAREDAPPVADGRAPGLLLLQKTHAGEAIDPQADRSRVPKDPQRHVAANYLALLMARFVWLHELAHCLHGHVALAQDNGLAVRLYEVPEALPVVTFARSDEEAQKQGRILRALELDADEAALLACCQIQIDGTENIEGIKALDLETRLGLTMFGVYAMTWLFEEYRSFAGAQLGTTHPDPYDRLRNVARVAATDVTSMVPGFERLHHGISMQFNALSRAIPAIHRVGEAAEPKTGAIGEDRATIHASLARYRFEPFTR